MDDSMNWGCILGIISNLIAPLAAIAISIIAIVISNKNARLPFHKDLNLSIRKLEQAHKYKIIISNVGNVSVELFRLLLRIKSEDYTFADSKSVQSALKSGQDTADSSPQLPKIIEPCHMKDIVIYWPNLIRDDEIFVQDGSKEIHKAEWEVVSEDDLETLILPCD